MFKRLFGLKDALNPSPGVPVVRNITLGRTVMVDPLAWRRFGSETRFPLDRDTLQIVAQRTAHPAHASIIFSMEALFAAIGGVLVLHELVTTRLVVGGVLMFVGMISSQLEPKTAQ